MTLPDITLDHLQTAIDLTDFDVRRAWQRMVMEPNLRRVAPPPGETPRQAGVLVMVYPHNGRLTTLLMRRTPSPGVHSGQISFPGGKHEPHDPDHTATALREACEEVGVCEKSVTLLGRLTEVYIPPSRFMVWPTVGLLDERPVFKPNPDEVAELLELPLSSLLDESRKHIKDMHLGGMTFRVPYYDVQGHVVWGATALMLSEMEARLRTVVNGSVS